MNFAELLSFAFVQRAIIGALLLAIGCGLLSFFVVQRNLAFMGHGVAHSMIAGVGLGVLLDWPVLWPALTVALVAGVGIGWISSHERVSEDSAIGITLSGALAVGLILVSLKQGYITNLDVYLFGSLLTIRTLELYLLAAFCAAIVGLLLWRWKIFLMFSFDPEGAAVAGYPVTVFRYGLLIVISAMIAVAMKMVGILLVGAFLVIPAAAAVNWSAKALHVVWLAGILAAVGAIFGMIVSLTLNLPAGAAIVLALVALFGVSRVIGPYRK
jgi:ABC-type Mn2+/Zn2+ transport system permease subunit